ncbi:hypothetical protein RHSIM_Rhsim07G0153000 [Rhododendron simsii]|uniref:Protein FAR1-RELATED SEQUENCE n=1 Tax=Rhododendron simsii TaxID=118357 RepID=A0A834LID9_RHOSS|nr:hypothetical protein RHSIM_Rhsim07G0153000 [Rhododendron simsii]
MTTTTTHQDMETDRQEESVMPPLTVQQPSMLCESSANSSQALYTPQVKNDLIPKINQEFDSLQKVKEFYNRYAKEGGFGPPKMIITDQDLAMTKAIASALPNTLHRYCMWHITNKFSENINALAYKEHYEEFKNCIWNSETPEQFEAGWVQVVKKSNLSGNDWLQNLYEIRERWVPAYVRHIFSAHMTSSQRAKITHSFFKRYVSQKNSLLEFVTRFERALARIRHNELDKDHKDVNERPNLKSMYPMEEIMSELYTIDIFYMFQDELFQNTAYKLMAKSD